MISVLIGDPQPLFAEALGIALSIQPDLQVVEPQPKTGSDAVEAIVRLSPDVALVDYWMDGMAGQAATRVILNKAPERKIILLCWFHGRPEIREGVSAGAAAVLSKDVEVPHLAEAIRQVNAGYPLLGGQETIAEEKTAAGKKDKTWQALLTLTPRELQILSTLRPLKTDP